MIFQSDPACIRWNLHLNSSPQKVFDTIATDAGRAQWWAESAIETDGVIHFIFPSGVEWRGRILESQPPRRFRVQYYGGSLTTFELKDDGQDGTDLILTDAEVPAEDRTEVIAGWVSVLMALKAAVDFGVDLRNHDPQRSWDQGYAEN